MRGKCVVESEGAFRVTIYCEFVLKDVSRTEIWFSSTEIRRAKILNQHVRVAVSRYIFRRNAYEVFETRA